MSDFPMRINKYLAHQGLSTRRGADTLIEHGKVLVNGKRAVVGQRLNEGDRVEVRGVVNKTFRYILYYKPRGVITHSPSANETDILAKIANDYGITGIFPIGRLDKSSEGLILLTDDGRVTERLLSPDTNHEKEYLVGVDKKVTKWFLRHLSEGVDIEGYKTKPAKAEAAPRNEQMFTIVLTEGKKHQVRRMCAALGYQVMSLKRVRIMELTLKNLKPGQFHELSAREAQQFRESLGLI